MSLFVFWPKSQPETDYFEQQYALKFCKIDLQDSLQKHNLLFNWADVDYGGTETLHHQLTKYVLVIKDPLVILNGTIVKMMMEVIDRGFNACGPQLNISSNTFQLARPLFPVLNTTSFEELNKMYVDQGEPQVEEIKILDRACVMYDSKYFFSHEINETSTVDIGYLDPQKGSRFAVLKNSFVFTFRSVHSSERNDLAELIPYGLKSILDVGCFYGGLGKTLRQLRPETETDGIEFSKFYATKASPFYRKIYNCTLEEFQNEKQYDVVVCGDLLEHLFDPWKQLCRIHDFLIPGGCLIISLPNASHWSLIYDQLHGKFEYLPWGITCITHLRWFTESSIRKALEDAGFQIERFERQQIEPSPNGMDFIKKMCELGIGDEQSLLTNEFIILAIKKTANLNGTY